MYPRVRAVETHRNRNRPRNRRRPRPRFVLGVFGRSDCVGNIAAVIPALQVSRAYRERRRGRERLRWEWLTLGYSREPAGTLTFMELTYTLTPEPTPEEQYRIIDPLIAYNEAQAGPRNTKEFTFFVHSETGELAGGLLGFTHLNHFFMAALFVHQQFRREGIGRELMKRAEALALAQGCDVIYLDTFDYQAPGFYEKLGFKVFGKLADYPPGHQRFYLMKRIRRR